MAMTVSQMGLGDRLDNYYDGLKPVPRMEINESVIMFFSSGEILERFNSLNSAVSEHADFCGNVNFEASLNENLTGTFELGQDLLFNLNGYSMVFSSSNDVVLHVKDGTIAKFCNGSISLHNVQLSVDGNVTMENVKVTSNKDFVVNGRMTVGKMTEVEFDQNDSFGIIVDNGNLVVEQTSVIESKGSCVKMDRNSNITLNGGKVYGDTGIIAMNNDSQNSLYIPDGSDVVVMGRGFGRFNPYSSSNSLQHLGNAIAVVSENTEQTIDVDIHAGKFISLKNVPVASYATGENSRISKFMNGGTLDRFPTESEYQYDSDMSSVVNVDYDVIANGCEGKRPCFISRSPSTSEEG